MTDALPDPQANPAVDDASCEHVVQFYDDDAYLLAMADRHLREELLRGAAVLVIATRAHLGALERTWAGLGLDLELARQQGRYVPVDVIDAVSRVLVAGRPDREAFCAFVEPLIETAARRHGRVVAFAEMVDLPWERGLHEFAVELEACWNELSGRHRFSLLCGYRMPRGAETPPDVLRRVCEAHARSIPTERFTGLTDAARARKLCEFQHKERCLDGSLQAQARAEAALAQREHDRQLFRAIVESSDDAIISKSLDGCVTSWNATAVRLFGWSAEEMIGRSIVTIIPPDLRHEEPMILGKLRRGERIDHYETTRITKDGRRIEVSLTVSPVRDAEGRVVGVSKIARDITDRKRLESQRRDFERRKDEFLAMLGHELRNPLAPIRNITEALRLTVDSEQQQLCSVLDRQIRLMTRLLDDLLDLTRITRGKIRFQRRALEIGAVIERAVESSRAAIEARRQVLELSVPDEPLPLHGDLDRLVQVVTNLLSNAVKYTPEGGRITVRVTHDGNTAGVHVEDTGEGITADMLPRIFEPFVQADRTVERSQGGLGIGLTLVRGIVEQHGGSIEASSAGEGKGSAFTVRLPLREGTSRPPAAPTDAGRGAPSSRIAS